ncbi:MAG: hypothetical protein LIO65_06500, partial [Odoribacter sp.]|nr:hypothetical protein [Odoribacter sp.]
NNYGIVEWKEDNIINIDTYYDGNKQEDLTYHFSYYSEYENELNLDFSVLLGDFDALRNEYMFEQGYLGQRNKNLLKSYSYLESKGDFKYEFKENCIVVSVYYSHGGGNSRLAEVMEIFYE